MKTTLLPYMLKGPDRSIHHPGIDASGSTFLARCRGTPIGRELLEMLQVRMVNLRDASERMAELVGPIHEVSAAVISSEALIDRLTTGESGSEEL